MGPGKYGKHTLSEEYSLEQSGRPARRHRPRRRARAEQVVSEAITPDLQGLAASYGDTLLFIGYEVHGRIEIVIYPAYRFASDDRVQGYLGYLWVPSGTPWAQVLAEVDRVYEAALRNYRLAAGMRSAELRTHGAGYQRAYDNIVDLFRESWHGFALRLKREGEITREGVLFQGTPPGPILVTREGQHYTLLVFPTGSILLVTGDRRRHLAGLASGAG
jgi:hypothetical protein